MLQSGVAVDVVDAVASVVTAARGGRRNGLVGVGAGALLLAALPASPALRNTVDQGRLRT